MKLNHLFVIKMFTENNQKCMVQSIDLQAVNMRPTSFLHNKQKKIFILSLAAWLTYNMTTIFSSLLWFPSAHFLLQNKFHLQEF